MKDDQEDEMKNRPLFVESYTLGNGVVNGDIISNLIYDIDCLKEDIDSLDKEISALETLNDNLASDNLKLLDEMESLEKQISSSIPKKRVEALVEKLREIQRHNHLSFNFGTSEGVGLAVREFRVLLSHQTKEEYSLTKSCGFDLKFIKGENDV